MRHKLDSSLVVFRGKVQEELQLTKEQIAHLEEFLPLIQQTQQQMDALMKEVPAGVIPEEVRPRVLKARADLETRLEALTYA